MKVKVNCSGCKQQVEIAAPELPQVLNTPSSSVLLFDHPYTAYCEHCRKPVALQIVTANPIVVAVPIEARETSQIVLPGNVDASKLRAHDA